MNRDGFTLIEVIVGMMILVVAVVALAGTTGFVGLQIRAADLRTDRSLARQQVIERLHATDFDTLDDVAKGSGVAHDGYTIWWDVSSLRWALKEVAVYTEGPGYRDGRYRTSIEDTVTVRIARPN